MVSRECASFADLCNNNKSPMRWYILFISTYSKTCFKRPLKKKTKVDFQDDCRLMQVKSIAECSKATTCL